jgi:BASS family bile acid:Na+ symporter
LRRTALDHCLGGGRQPRAIGRCAALLLALLIVNLFGYAGGYCAGYGARLPVAMRKALALEVGMQNAGLGTFLAALLFGQDSAAQIPTAAYTFGCMLTGTVLASVWGRKLNSPTESYFAGCHAAVGVEQILVD